MPHDRDLEEVRRADEPLLEHLLHREVVPVPAPVLEDAEQHAVTPARLDHRVGLAGVQAHHLVGDDVLPGAHRLDRERRVGVVRRGEDDEVDAAALEQVADRRERGDPLLALGLLPSLRRARGDRDELQLGHSLDEVGVKATPGESVSDESNLDHWDILQLGQTASAVFPDVPLCSQRTRATASREARTRSVCAASPRSAGRRCSQARSSPTSHRS